MHVRLDIRMHTRAHTHTEQTGFSRLDKATSIEGKL